MRFLCDTHIVLWAVFDSSRLSVRAKTLLNDPANTFVFSAVSFWEIAIKRALGRPGFQPDPLLLKRTLLDTGYEELALTCDHTMAMDGLPAIHKDIFDRILIAQAMTEGLTLLTADADVLKYPGPIHRV